MNFTLKRKRRSESSPPKGTKPEASKPDEDTEDEFNELATPTLTRKRKRRSSGDVHNASSASLSVKDSFLTLKKSKRLSLVSLLTTPIKPVFRSLHNSHGKSSSCELDETVVPQRKSLLRRSCSILRSSMGPPAAPPCSSVRTSTPQRLTRSWSQSVASLGSCLVSHVELKRQEAIHELYMGEVGMVLDLELVTNTYRSSLLQLNILSQQEIECIFGDLNALLLLHSTLRDKLQALRDSSGVVKNVGNVLLQWVPGLEAYMSYCARHLQAKAVLDEKKESNKRFQDFLQRCLESPFSRKLDLWTFLDFPRNRVVKYPILVGEILRHTPDSHPDSVVLAQANTLLRCLLQKADRVMGVAECQRTVARLVWPEGGQAAIEAAASVLCEGDLREQRGAKMHCILFDVGFLITRSDKRTNKLIAVSNLIPPSQIELEELQPLRNSRNTSRCFRVGCKGEEASAFVFTASNEHSCKHWMDSIKQLQLRAQPPLDQKPI